MDRTEEVKPAARTIDLRLDVNELALLRTGLQILEDTFGHEEAEELEEVQALLARLDELEAPQGDRTRA
jgi:hypothetical protein